MRNSIERDESIPRSRGRHLQGDTSSTESSNAEYAHYPGTESLDIMNLYKDDISKYPLLTHKEEIELSRVIKYGSAAHHRLNQLINISEDEFVALQEAVLQGKQAFETMWTCNTRLVINQAKKQRLSNVMTFLDYIQEGNLGLIKAIEKFDPEKGYKFSTYAIWWIRQSMIRARQNKAHAVRIPIHKREEMYSIDKAIRSLYTQLGRDATIEEIVQYTGKSVESIKSLLSISQDVVSLEQHLPNSELTYADAIAMDDEPIEDTLIKAENLKYVNDLLIDVPQYDENIYKDLPKEYIALYVVKAYFGFFGGEKETYQTIADRIGLSREMVRIHFLKGMNLLKQQFSTDSSMSQGLSMPDFQPVGDSSAEVDKYEQYSDKFKHTQRKHQSIKSLYEYIHGPMKQEKYYRYDPFRRKVQNIMEDCEDFTPEERLFIESRYLCNSPVTDIVIRKRMGLKSYEFKPIKESALHKLKSIYMHYQ